ncbi:hypothetical protein MTO96_041870 [Rhipicephalus appendiculatus]
MKASKPGDGSHHSRAASSSTKKKDKTHGGAPTPNAKSVAFGSRAAPELDNQAAQNVNGYREATTVPPNMPQLPTPHTIPQPISNQPDTSSMAAVLLALRMVGLSPQPDSEPVIWIPVGVPQPPTTQVVHHSRIFHERIILK